MSTNNALDRISETMDDSENEFLSAVPVLPEGMVDVALSELGARITDVFLIEEEPLYHTETIDL